MGMLGELSARYKYSADKGTCEESERQRKQFSRLVLKTRIKQYLSNTLSTDLFSKVQRDIKGLRSLKLCGFELGDRGAWVLGKALATNQTLKLLDLGFNAITEKGIVQVAKALQVNQVLTTLYLSGNCIGVNGATQIATGLRRNNTLQVLYLSGNGIGEEGARHVAEALKVNTTLKSLYIGTNAIGLLTNLFLSQVLSQVLIL